MVLEFTWQLNFFCDHGHLENNAESPLSPSCDEEDVKVEGVAHARAGAIFKSRADRGIFYPTTAAFLGAKTRYTAAGQPGQLFWE